MDNLKAIVGKGRMINVFGDFGLWVRNDRGELTDRICWIETLGLNSIKDECTHGKAWTRKYSIIFTTY